MEGVGPSASMTIDLAPRLNLFAGDNGLGKSFILDVAWWALTRTWAGEPIRPPMPRIKIAVRRPAGSKATVGGATVKAHRRVPRVAFELDIAQGKRVPEESFYDRASQAWMREKGRRPIPGLILYARVDGSFCVWDSVPSSGTGDCTLFFLI